MTKRMLIDAAHSEEVRVVIMEDDRIEEFEVESASKEQIRGNVYVAEIQRVEPSLQACFVDYGGNRNGFLAFSEIHPGYFNLSDEEKAELIKELEEISQRRSAPRPSGPRRHARGGKPDGKPNDDTNLDDEDDADLAEGAQALSAESAGELEEENLEAVQAEETKKVAARKAGASSRRRPRRATRKETPESENDDEDDNDEEEEEEVVVSKTAAPARKPKSEMTAEELLSEEEREEDARALALANSMIVKELTDNDVPPALQGEIKGRGRGGRDQNKGRGRGDQAKGRGRGGRNDRNDKRRNDKDTDLAAKAAAPKNEATTDANDQPASAEKQHSSNNSGRRQQPIHRRYNIADVLQRGQKVLVQVAKEERGTKGAALTTFVSLPGRFTVLMPNTPYAGGISRKITDLDERRQLKNITEALNVPEGMGLIVRTAGLGQTQENITQDLKHLLQHWEKLNKNWKEEPARTCVHEDGSLIIRALRDMFSDDIDEIIVSGEKAQKACKDYMNAIIPEHVKRLKEYKGKTPLFSEYDVEMELHHMNRTRVNLPSGGYLIINPTEALVSVDVNSGRSTGERNIEETAVKTNLEAAKELGRQLRLRDLAGLIVIDFIDMDDRRNERAVERAMRDAIKRDRARIQIGQISDFGLLEMSRQRMRPSLGETSFVTCPHCQGNGLVRSPASSALMILRGIEEANHAEKADRIIITTSHEVAVYMLNYKRDMIAEMESRYKTRIIVTGDNEFVAPDHRLELVRVESDGTEKKTTSENRWRELSAEEEQAQNKRRRRRRGGRKGRDEQSDNRPEKAASQGRDKPESGDKQNRGRKDNRRGGRNKDSEQNAKAADTTSQKTEGQIDEKAAAAHTPEADVTENGNERRRPRRTQLGRRRTRRDGEDAPTDAAQAQDAPRADKAAVPPAKAEPKAAEAKPARSPRKTTAAPIVNKPVERIVVEVPKDEAPAKAAKKPAAKRGRPAKKDAPEAKTAKAKPAAPKRPAVKTESKPLVVEHIGSDGNSVPTNSEADKKSVFQRWWSK